METAEAEPVYKGCGEASRSWIKCKSTSHEENPAHGAAAAQAREALETLGGGNPRRPFMFYSWWIVCVDVDTIVEKLFTWNKSLPKYEITNLSKFY